MELINFMRLSYLLTIHIVLLMSFSTILGTISMTIEADCSLSRSTAIPNSKISTDLLGLLSDDVEELKLIVQFKDGPSSSDIAFVEGLGFAVERSFHIVPALSIRGPANALDRLVRSETIKFVEHNDPIVLDMEMGTWVINATEVWASLVMDDSGRGWDEPIDGTGVTVCVVDTGIDAGHPDLDYGLKTVQNVYDAGGGVWIESENTDTNYGHGTHVAGTVAGNGDASAGARRGVAPGANLIGVTVSIPEELTTPTEDGYIQGLEWVYDHSRPDANPHNIRCVTNSWHSTVEEYNPDSLLTQVIEKLAFENNVLSTWSAGNDGRDDPEGNELTTSGQGNTPVAIMVAAYERDGSAITDFSSRGKVGDNHTYPDVGAPGRYIWSTSARRTVISGGSYVGGNTNPYYLAISGTSMSTPHVAGLTALLWQAAPSMTISNLHEDYSGDNPDAWYENPNTRIHEVEWIIEASAKLLPPTTESGNVAGDSETTGWGSRSIDYVQGYGIVDARKAVGIALTLEHLRSKYPDRDITVMDAIEAYEKHEVSGSYLSRTGKASASWSGEYSRYNDQFGKPLSVVNQTKYVIVPENATEAEVRLEFTTIDLTEFKAADLAFTIDFNSDGIVDYQSDLMPGSQGIDTAQLEVSEGGTWTFDIIGMGIKKPPRPTKEDSYVELRIEYEMSVSFSLPENGTNLKSTNRPNALVTTLMPADSPDGGEYMLEVSRYDTSQVSLPEPVAIKKSSETQPPYALLLALIIIIIAVAASLKRRKRGKPMDA